MWGLTSKLALKIHGRWCGPGHSGPGEPIDGVDAQCRDHDLCYQQRGYGDCECDAELVVELMSRLESPGSLTRRGWWAARFICLVFWLRPCVRKKIRAIES